MRKEHILCCVSGPVFVVRHPEHLECKVLDVGCACRLDVDGVIWANLLLEAFEGVEEIEEKLAGIGVLRFEGYAQLCGVVGSWIAVSECWRGRERRDVHQYATTGSRSTSSSARWRYGAMDLRLSDTGGSPSDIVCWE